MWWIAPVSYSISHHQLDHQLVDIQKERTRNKKKHQQWEGTRRRRGKWHKHMCYNCKDVCTSEELVFPPFPDEYVNMRELRHCWNSLTDLFQRYFPTFAPTFVPMLCINLMHLLLYLCHTPIIHLPVTYYLHTYHLYTCTRVLYRTPTLEPLLVPV